MCCCWLQVIGRTGPDLLTAALEAVGLQRTKGMFERSYSQAGVGEPSGLLYVVGLCVLAGLGASGCG